MSYDCFSSMLCNNTDFSRIWVVKIVENNFGEGFTKLEKWLEIKTNLFVEFLTSVDLIDLNNQFINGSD